MVADHLGVGVLPEPERLEQIALGEDAHALGLGVEDDRGADLALGHELGRFAQRVARPDRQHDAAHPVTNLHSSLLLDLLATFDSIVDPSIWIRISGYTVSSGGNHRHAGSAPHDHHASARSLFEEAVAIVEREYADDLALDDIARRVATSRRQLQRAYSEVGDTTFREHLTAVRMERAGDMLRHASLTIREVAHRVGYRQPAQFAKAFRRHHGVAPSDFRAAEQRFARLGRRQQRRACRSPEPTAIVSFRAANP